MYRFCVKIFVNASIYNFSTLPLKKFFFNLPVLGPNFFKKFLPLLMNYIQNTEQWMALKKYRIIDKYNGIKNVFIAKNYIKIIQNIADVKKDMERCHT